MSFPKGSPVSRNSGCASLSGELRAVSEGNARGSLLSFCETSFWRAIWGQATVR